MKKIFVAIMALIMTFTFAGCSQSKKAVDIPTFMKEIRSSVDLPDMAEITKNRISGYYEINADDIEDMACIMATSGATADEIFIVKMKDEKKVSEVKTAMEDRKTMQSDLFKDYAPGEMTKIDNCVIETKGNYAFFAICNDSSKAKKLFTDSF